MRHRDRDVPDRRAGEVDGGEGCAAQGRRLTTGRAGFGPATFAFLRELAANQEKAWFEANRARYEGDLRGPCAAIAEMVAAAFAMRGVPLTGGAKQSLFRIHRDVRFSKDKRPYKTNGGVTWMRSGLRKLSPGIVYLHVADEGCFVSAGFYGLERDALDALRAAIRDGPARYRAAMAAAAAAGLHPRMLDPMKRLPRGFEDVVEPDLADAVRARHLLVSRDLTRAEMAGAGLAELVAGAAEAALPLLRFGWDAVAEVSAAGSSDRR